MAYFLGFRNIKYSAEKDTALSSTVDLKQRLDRRSMSPTTRTKTWLAAPTPKKDIKTPDILRVKGSKIVKTFALPPSFKKSKPSTKGQTTLWSKLLPTFFSNPKAQEDEEDALEGETLIDDVTSNSISEDVEDTLIEDPESPKHHSVQKPSNAVPSATELEHANLSILNEEKKEHFFNIEAERALREGITQNITRRGSWTPNELFLFHKLNMRGFEPILPVNWKLDFPTMPTRLFGTANQDVYISSLSGKDFRATKALQSLFAIGPIVRARLDASLSPEEPLRRELLSYYKWSLFDASIAPTAHIPNLAIVAAKANESTASVIGRVTDQLHDLGRQYREKLRIKEGSNAGEDGEEKYTYELPTLYGAVIKYSVVAIVTYDAAVPGKEVRSIGVFDFGKGGQDVWHGYAMAILVIHARNYLLDLEDEEDEEMVRAVEEASNGQ